MKSWENEVNEDLVADVKTPAQLSTAFINILVSDYGGVFDTSIKFGKKEWHIAKGTQEEMLKKRDRLLKFIHDPFAPVPESLEEFVQMARGV